MTPRIPWFRFWLLASFLTSVATAFPGADTRLGACGVSFREFSAGYSKFELDGELTPEVAVGKDFVMSEKHGLVRVKEFDPATGDLLVEIARKSVISQSRFLGTKAETRGRFAKLGSAAAREILEARTKQHFTRPERFPYFFALKGLHSIVEKSSKGNERWEYMNQAWTSVRSQFPELAALDLNGITDKWRAMFPSEGHFPPNDQLQERYTAALDALVREYHRQTGVNLVKSGIVADGQAIWGYGAAMWRSPFMGTATNISSWGTHKGPYLGGIMSEVPIDIAMHAMATSWREADAKFPEPGRDIYASGYVADTTDLNTSMLFDFKNRGDIRSVLPVIEPVSRSPRFQAFRGAIPEGALVLSVPSATGENKSGPALGEWLAQKLPGTKYVPNGITTSGGRPQKYQENILDRLTNTKSVDATVAANVRGKVVILADDLVASGATTERLKQELLRAGASAVHVFSIAKTGGPSEFDAAAGLVNLPSPVVVTKPAMGNIEKRDFIATVPFPLPWSAKKVKELEPAERQTKDRFERAFKEADVVTLYALPEAQLDQVDAKGRPVKLNDKETFLYTLNSDDAVLVDYLNSFKGVSESPDFETIKGSPLGQALLKRAKDRLSYSPFVNRAGTTLVDWIKEQ